MLSEKIIKDSENEALSKENVLKQKGLNQKEIEELMNFRKSLRLLGKVPFIKNVGRFEFMQIMYNAFPQIRESYYLYLQKNPSATKTSYLKIKSRNIK